MEQRIRNALKIRTAFFKLLALQHEQCTVQICAVPITSIRVQTVATTKVIVQQNKVARA